MDFVSEVPLKSEYMYCSVGWNFQAFYVDKALAN